VNRNQSAILPYLGGKRTLAPRIVDALCAGGPPIEYVEPFHGSLAVLLELRKRGFGGRAIVNDANGLVSNLARCLADRAASQALSDMIDATPFHEREYLDALDYLASDRSLCPAPGGLRVDTARAYLIASWMGRNGFSGMRAGWESLRSRFCVRWTNSGGDPAGRWASVKRSLPGWAALLSSKTTFLCRDALEVLRKARRGTGVAVYVDPPYLNETRSTRYAVDVDDGTGTLAESDDFHASLASILDEHRSAGSCVVASYYAHDRLARLYAPGLWRHDRIDVPKATDHGTRGKNKRDRKRAVEVLISANTGDHQ